MSLLPTSMTTSLIQAAQARIFAFRKKKRSGSGAGESSQDVGQAQPGIDHVDLAEASQKLTRDSRTASRQGGGPHLESPALRRIDLTA